MLITKRNSIANPAHLYTSKELYYLASMKPLIITKSLFKEFTQSPKLARRHINDKTVYNAIQDDQYGGMDGLEVGQEVERIVMQRFVGQTIHNVTIS
ncbi:hypothetical protein KA037_05140 [Patescibacteria group bacterium]|nr:hypothetical protein [Patescibacteria group bacterium]MBP7842010.1 hypothetical protein [Patescibacteria group bacterium]